MKIYTGRGDKGRTDLRDMTRVAKDDDRIEAYGSVDEANAIIGTARPAEGEDVNEVLSSVQNHLHIVQADLANPSPDDDDPQMSADHVNRLEEWIDRFDEELDPLESFILPGGDDIGARIHHARTVVRRSERRVVQLADGQEINEEVLRYLNRLSDLLFTIARLVNSRAGNTEHSPSY